MPRLQESAAGSSGALYCTVSRSFLVSAMYITPAAAAMRHAGLVYGRLNICSTPSPKHQCPRPQGLVVVPVSGCGQQLCTSTFWKCSCRGCRRGHCCGCRRARDSKARWICGRPASSRRTSSLTSVSYEPTRPPACRPAGSEYTRRHDACRAPSGVLGVPVDLFEGSEEGDLQGHLPVLQLQVGNRPQEGAPSHLRKSGLCVLAPEACSRSRRGCAINQ